MSAPDSDKNLLIDLGETTSHGLAHIGVTIVDELLEPEHDNTCYQ